MEGVCLGIAIGQELLPGAAIRGTPVRHCLKTSKAYCHVVFPNTYQVGFHNSCHCNEYRALAERHLVVRPTMFDPDYFKRTVKTIQLPETSRISAGNFVSHYMGAKRRVYERARERIKFGFDRNFAKISMFVKPDRYAVSELASKAPRAIQFRHPCYNISVGCYLRPVEEAFYGMAGPLGIREVAKGLNNLERAECLQSAMAHFRNPSFVLIDYSKFDSHVRVEHLKYLHKNYSTSNNSRWLQYLLKFQLVNKGYSLNGLRYKVPGTRMSGDFDTGLGNTMLNIAVLNAWLMGVKHYKLVDGDDSVIVLERSALSTLDMLHFSKCGLTAEMVVVNELHEVEFCQAKYLPVEPPRFARDYRKAMSKLQLAFKQFDNAVPRYLAGVGMGEMAASSGVPMIYSMAKQLAALSDKPILDQDAHHKYGHYVELDVTNEVRVAYALAWGYSIAEQLAIEQQHPFLVEGRINYFNCKHESPTESW